MSTEEYNLKRDLFFKFPGLYIKQIKKTSYIISGVIHIKEKWTRLKLYLPHFPQVREYRAHVQQGLEYKRYNNDNLQIEANWNVQDLLEHIVHLQPPIVVLDSISNHRTNIYAEILELHKPQDYRLQVNETCTRLRFSNFADFESHYLKLELPSMRVLEHSLPDCVLLDDILAGNTRTLTDVLNVYVKLLEELRPFYDSFVDIDELCDVLQPSPITSKHNTRVFPLKDRVYLKVAIGDPFASYASMAVQIIGPTEEVSHLRHVLSEGLSSWDTDQDMHKNLLRIFDLCYFPMRSTIELSQLQMEEEEQHCNICYVFRLDDGDVPIVSCDNPRCVLKCHAACLKEWFDTLVDGKTFLEVSFGLCPFCKGKLSTSFAALLKN